MPHGSLADDVLLPALRQIGGKLRVKEFKIHSVYDGNVWRRLYSNRKYLIPAM